MFYIFLIISQLNTKKKNKTGDVDKCEADMHYNQLILTYLHYF
jgi:hypothetical protein